MLSDPVVAGEDHQADVVERRRRHAALCCGQPDAEIAESAQGAGRGRQPGQSFGGGSGDSGIGRTHGGGHAPECICCAARSRGRRRGTRHADGPAAAVRADAGRRYRSQGQGLAPRVRSPWALRATMARTSLRWRRSTYAQYASAPPPCAAHTLKTPTIKGPQTRGTRLATVRGERGADVRANGCLPRVCGADGRGATVLQAVRYAGGAGVYALLGPVDGDAAVLSPLRGPCPGRRVTGRRVPRTVAAHTAADRAARSVGPVARRADLGRAGIERVAERAASERAAPERATSSRADTLARSAAAVADGRRRTLALAALVPAHDVRLAGGVVQR